MTYPETIKNKIHHTEVMIKNKKITDTNFENKFVLNRSIVVRKFTKIDVKYRHKFDK